jgi:integrase
LKLLKRGRLKYDPARDDLVTVLLSDGHLNGPVRAVKPLSLKELFARYQAERPLDRERNTAYTEDINVAHLLRVLGALTSVIEIDSAALQRYVTARAQEKNRRGGVISQVTLKKELATLSSIWNQWALPQGLVGSSLSLRRLRYPKGTEPAPFQTWEQIERRIRRARPSEKEQEEMWDSLYLKPDEIESLLDHVKQAKYPWKNSRFPWVYPMFAFAAYTGARRSEVLRSRIEDLDFEAGEVLIREKKKDRTKRLTVRHVPMTGKLRDILQAWLAKHPGGPFTFSKAAGEPIAANMANHYLRWVLDGSKWNVVRGWHVFRHSLISNLASQGTSESLLMAVAGHLNRETTRRYAHLIPSAVREALGRVFGVGPAILNMSERVRADEPAAAV